MTTKAFLTWMFLWTLSIFAIGFPGLYEAFTIEKFLVFCGIAGGITLILSLLIED